MEKRTSSKFVSNSKLEYMLLRLPVVLQKEEFPEGDPSHSAVKKYYFNHVAGAFASKVYGVRLVASRATWDDAQEIAPGEFLRVEDVFMSPFKGGYDLGLADIRVKRYPRKLERTVTFLVFDVERIIDNFLGFAYSRSKEGLSDKVNSAAVCRALVNYAKKQTDKIRELDREFKDPK